MQLFENKHAALCKWPFNARFVTECHTKNEKPPHVAAVWAGRAAKGGPRETPTTSRTGDLQIQAFTLAMAASVGLCL